MSKITKKILGASLSLAAFSFGYAQNVQAQSCVVLPTCEELGYTDIAARCENGELLKCPFDESKVFCRFVPTSKECNTVGDILYDDMTCAININKLEPTRTAIGIVFDPEKRLAIALKSIDGHWTTQKFDLPDINYTSKETVEADWNGKKNTKIIIDYCQANSISCPVVEAAYSYTTEGTNIGDWYLPSVPELQAMTKNFDILQQRLKLLKGDSFPDWGYHWSSSGYNYSMVWSVLFKSGGSYTRTKDYYTFSSRPVINY